MKKVSMDLDHIKELYIKKLLSKHSDEESIALQKYLDQHQGTEGQLRQYAKSLMAHVKDEDVEVPWQVLKSKLPNKRRSIFDRQYMAVAALLFLSLGAVLIILLNKSISYRTIIAQGENGYERYILVDGSQVWLQNGSTLMVDRAMHLASERHIQLSGQAFFEVAKDKEHPFIIEANQSRIQVLGTSFNVKTSDSVNTVVVSEGKVMVQHDNKKEVVFLTANQGVRDIKGILTKLPLVDENYNAWFTGKFTFDNKPLSDVIHQLNEHYNNQLILDPQSDNHCALTATIDQLTIEEVIELLQLSCQVKAEKLGQQYRIH